MSVKGQGSHRIQNTGAGYGKRFGTGTLTPRLLEVVHRILLGRSSAKEIALDLNISDKTAETLKAALFKCLGVHGAVELIVKERDGLLAIPGWGWREMLLEAAKETEFLKLLAKRKVSENFSTDRLKQHERNTKHRVPATTVVGTSRTKETGGVYKGAIQERP